MMSKTHIAIGAATALMGSVLTTPEDIGIALIGGVVGGIVADNDILDNDFLGDALLGQLLAAGITAGVILLDLCNNCVIVNGILAAKWRLILGVALFAILYFIGMTQPHRGFTHSILALILYSIAAGIIYTPLMFPFVLGYASHLMIDLLNKRGIMLLFPLKFRICFGLCYANETANKVLMIAGIVVSLFAMGLALPD